MVYMGDFNARHSSLGDLAGTVNCNGNQLLQYIRRNQLTRWDTGGSTHSRGGTLDHILTCGLVPSRVQCTTVPTLFSDHVGLSIQYSLPAAPTPIYSRAYIIIPPKYTPMYISYITNLLPTFDLHCPEKLYSSLVSATHDFHTRYIRKPHIRHRANAMTLDNRISQAEKKAMDDGFVFMRQPSPETLHQYQLSRDDQVALQHCVLTDSWHKLTDSINHQTSIGSIWHLINRIVKKKPPSVLHHSPAQYAQDLINEWSTQSRSTNLPAHIQDTLSTHENHHALRLSTALLSTDEEDDVPITEEELRRALARNKKSAPGDDGITYCGVLSPFLFNILLHRLLSLLPDTDNTTITCYADDICIHSGSPEHLQNFLSSFYEAASSCGLIISPEKSRIFSPRPVRYLPEFTVGNNVVPLCTQYLYLGAPVQITPSIPARQRVHPIVQDLLARLQRRLTPLKWLINYSAGVSIPVARTIYITLIRSVVDYLSPALCQLSRSTLQPLEKFQNQAMRLILGCLAPTRIVNMQHELRLPPLVERIYSNVTYFSIKCLYYPHLSPHYSHIIRTSLDLDAPRPQLRQGGRKLVNTVCSSIWELNVNIVAEDVDHGLAPWQTPVPAISYTPVSKTDLPQLQRQRALETIDRLSSSLSIAHHYYTDGSLQQDGSAGCAVFSPTLEPPQEGWTGRRLSKSSSSTYCELHGLLDAVTLITQTRNNGLIICDSQSALQALSSHKPAYHGLVTQILRKLDTANMSSLVVHFLWIPSHVGLLANSTVDRLAKAACQLDPPDADAPTPSLLCCKKMVYQAARSPTHRRSNAERATSVSIQHYDHFLPHQHKYRRNGLMVRRNNVVCARLRLGWRPVWQVAGQDGAPQFSSCRLCDAPNANTLEHYCLECPLVTNLLPQIFTVVDVCKQLLTDYNLLDEILMHHPHFGGH
ncbi:uncharacterized protein [Macrobrachium rosenbergii]|uniref:uncharacterized protein n=1 Tax=Macrobrachium rosenbergii TaxID=79674 RepID=UPI0034D637EE